MCFKLGIRGRGADVEAGWETSSLQPDGAVPEENLRGSSGSILFLFRLGFEAGYRVPRGQIPLSHIARSTTGARAGSFSPPESSLQSCQGEKGGRSPTEAAPPLTAKEHACRR